MAKLRKAISRTAMLCAVIGMWSAPNAHSEEVRVAVAANFLETLRALQPLFENSTGHRLAITSGSTGLLFAQITNGAPFDMLLAADSERPALLARDGFAAPAASLDGTSPVFTYAVGRLALWSAAPARVDDGTLSALGQTAVRWIAIAEPQTAPYGAAAREVLENLGVFEQLLPRIVRGHNVAQTFAMIETGNAEIGFVALSQAYAWTGEASFVVVPETLHAPIRQDAVVLARAADNPAALAFAVFLRSAVAAEVIEQRGYSAVATQP